jgi:hypothetical protein
MHALPDNNTQHHPTTHDHDWFHDKHYHFQQEWFTKWREGTTCFYSLSAMNSLPRVDDGGMQLNGCVTSSLHCQPAIWNKTQPASWGWYIMKQNILMMFTCGKEKSRIGNMNGKICDCNLLAQFARTRTFAPSSAPYINCKPSAQMSNSI